MVIPTKSRKLLYFIFIILSTSILIILVSCIYRLNEVSLFRLFHPHESTDFICFYNSSPDGEIEMMSSLPIFPYNVATARRYSFPLGETREYARYIVGERTLTFGGLWTELHMLKTVQKQIGGSFYCYIAIPTKGTKEYGYIWIRFGKVLWRCPLVKEFNGRWEWLHWKYPPFWGMKDGITMHGPYFNMVWQKNSAWNFAKHEKREE